MASRNQASIKTHRRLRATIRGRVDALYPLKYTQIAKEVGHDLAVVSKAINHGEYPRVLKKVRAYLNV